MIRQILPVVLVLSSMGLASGQSLAEVAKREKERRNQADAEEPVIDAAALRRGELPSSSNDENGDESKKTPADILQNYEGLGCKERHQRISDDLETLGARFERGTGDVPCSTYIERARDFPNEARECRDLSEKIRVTRKAKKTAGRCLTR